MKRISLLIVMLFFGVSIFSSVLAQDDFQQIIESRQANYREMGGSYKGIRDELQKKKPLMVMLRAHTDQLQMFARDQAVNDWFPIGSGHESEIETESLPAIWEQRDEFDTLQQKLKVEVDALVKLISSRDMDQIKKQNRVVGKVCKQCHDTYREEED